VAEFHFDFPQKIVDSARQSRAVWVVAKPEYFERFGGSPLWVFRENGAHLAEIPQR
jgi:hypothetical protein